MSVHNQLYEYIESRHLLNPLQTGYSTGHSTQTAFLKLSVDIRRSLGQRQVTMLLLFDFSKAFDSVCHVTLFGKLREAKLFASTIKWFASYLVGRELAMLGHDGNLSSFAPLNKGVPQSSILGPLLFYIYINDIVNCFEDLVSHLIYADDLQIYAKFILLF